MVPLPAEQTSSTYIGPQAAKSSDSARRASAQGPKVLTFALQHRPRATRASVPKVRTGCITCKKRHVKCDEAKPSCQRCMKWQGYCDGYDTPAQSAGSSSTSSAASQKKRPSTATAPVPASAPAPAPASASSGSSTSSASSASPSSVETTPSPPPVNSIDGNELAMVISGRRQSLPRQPSPDDGMFRFQLDKLYFDKWLALAPNLGGGWFKSRLWTHTIPQLCREEPAVKYATMAIGAMANAMAQRRSALCYQITDVATQPHYKNALTYYGQALRMIGLQKMQDDAARLRAAVIACLLFVCFETLHGNRRAAVGHITHGLQIVDQFVQMASDNANESLTTVTTTSSPAPFVIEDEVMQVFRRLDFQAWSLGVFRAKRTQPSDTKIPALKPIPMQAIPLSFVDLEEARNWWDLVQHWVIQFPRFMVSELQKHAAALDPETAKRLDICDVPGARYLQKSYLECLESWNRAFWPLYNAARQNKKNDEVSYLKSISLQIQYLIAWIGLRSIAYSDYETMYQLTPQFRELNRLGGILLPKQPKYDDSDEIFTMDNGPTMALFIVSTKCRQQEVREEAIRLLQAYPRRDGFWDTRPLVAIADGNRPVEAENETEGTLCEQWVRLRQREAIFDEKKPLIQLTVLRKDPATGQFRRVSEVITW